MFIYVYACITKEHIFSFVLISRNQTKYGYIHFIKQLSEWRESKFCKITEALHEFTFTFL